MISLGMLVENLLGTKPFKAKKKRGPTIRMTPEEALTAEKAWNKKIFLAKKAERLELGMTHRQYVEFAQARAETNRQLRKKKNGQA